MTYWKLVGRLDARARVLADRHYSRQHPGYREFCPPGNNIVLLGLNDDALWVSHRPDPTAQLLEPRKDGFEYWDNPYFRNESGQVASELIKQALAITMGIWEGPLTNGFHSFVDSKHVKPTIRRGNPVYGWCFERAGFLLYPHLTKDKKLHRWIFTLEQLRALEPIEPVREQLALF